MRSRTSTLRSHNPRIWECRGSGRATRVVRCPGYGRVRLSIQRAFPSPAPRGRKLPPPYGHHGDTLGVDPTGRYGRLVSRRDHPNTGNPDESAVPAIVPSARCHRPLGTCRSRAVRSRNSRFSATLLPPPLGRPPPISARKPVRRILCRRPHICSIHAPQSFRGLRAGSSPRQ